MSTGEVTQLRDDVKARLRSRVSRCRIGMLGASRHERSELRCGYRNGSIKRKVTTAQGLDTITIPRARLTGGDGETSEFRSQLLPRYPRRTREVDEAILGAYLAGANTRRIQKALSALLGEEHLSKSAISRVLGRLKELFARPDAAWG